MKRIVIITRGFTGSTLPLAKEFLKRGYAVDYYLLTYTNISNLEAFNCHYDPLHNGLSKIPHKYWCSLDSYMEIEDINFYCIKLPRPFSSIPFIRFLLSVFSSKYYNEVCSIINEKCYDMLYISCGYYSFEYIPILKNLDKTKVVVGLHEVCNHFSPNFEKPSRLLKLLFKERIRIVVHSDKSYTDILKYNQVKSENIDLIHFGLFSSYNSIFPAPIVDLLDDYFLFFGVFRDYKGLGLLYDAVSQLDKSIKCKCVVAGSGNDPALNNIKNDNRFVLIHKFLTNEELVYLIKNAKFIVCPYLTVSQSGIPQTTFVFGKPIIASDLEGIKDVVINKENGLLFESKDSASLAHTISVLCNESDLYNQLAKNAKKFEKLHPEYSWHLIAEHYLSLIDVG